MKYSFLLLFTFSVSVVYAQVDYDEIKKKTTDPESEYFYTKILERFNNSDSTLTEDDFEAFYYGSVFIDSYDPEKISQAEESIREANYSHDYLRAYEIADSLLKVYPASIQAYFEKGFACFNLKRFEEETFNNKRYKVLVRTILHSGDGKSITNAWYANLSNDEYEVVKYLQLEIKEVKELDVKEQFYDVFYLKSNKAKMKEAFFNVTAQNK